ncbi:MAG: NAD(P)-dependent alcohol dehydrogenase [Nocardioides sp.]
MRAAVYREYGAPSVVSVQELDRPVPRADEVLVRVRATTVNSGDARLRSSRFPRGFGLPAKLIFGFRRPRRPVLGGVFSGVIEEIGGGASGFSVGDEVAGMNGAAMGCHAEYVVVKAKRVARKPAAVGHREAAAALFGGTTALTFVRDQANVSERSRVLVNGAAGSVGTAAVQLARHLGGEVTGVCGPANADRVRSAGAARIIDYTRTPLSSVDDSFDLVVDTVGNLGVDGGRRLLAPGGRLALVAADLSNTLRARGDAVAGVAKESAANFADVLALVESGALTPVISDVLPLDRIREAHAVVDSGHKVGNIVIEP